MRKKRTAIYMTVNKVLVRLDQRANLIGVEILRNARGYRENALLVCQGYSFDGMVREG